MTDGRVLASARARGLDSLTKVAKALIDEHPELFEGIAVRSLGAKLSELNRENVTWWRGREDRLEALGSLLGLGVSELVAAEQARRRGLWVCEEFPELPALNLMSEQPPTLAETVATASRGAHPPSLEDWLLVGLGSDHEQPPLRYLGRGVKWLYAPKATGRSLLLARIQARNRVEVFAGDTLADVVERVSPLRPAVLAPAAATSLLELVALSRLDAEQPVLVISAHQLPRPEGEEASRSRLPSWEWLSATPSERARSVFAAEGAGISGGIFERDPIIEFRLQLLPVWRSRLLRWVEERFTRQADTLFSAEGLTKWLEAFDPDEVFFPTPAAVLSLARISHEVGERRLPSPDSRDAGVQLVKQLGHADSRYLSLLARLVTHRWLDAGTPWHQAGPWDDWRAAREPRRAQPEVKKVASRRVRAGAEQLSGTDTAAPLAESDLDAAAKADILFPNSDGNYGFRSHAEAALVLRDLLRNWMQAGDLGMWGAQAIGDEQRQQQLDAVLATLDNSALVEMCRLAAKLPAWRAGALGASETLFLAAGLRMAAGTLSYRAELGALLKQTLARCVSDNDYIQLPLSRTLATEASHIDWTRALWGWSLVAPRPEWIPAYMSDRFPGWAIDNVDWLVHLRVPDSAFASLPTAHFRRMAAALNTAVDVAERVESSLADTGAPAVLKALVGLLRAARGKQDVRASWWHDIAQHDWALAVLAPSLVGMGSEVQLLFAAALLQACCTKDETGFGVYSLVRSRVWLQLLDVKDAAGLCDKLTPEAMAFVAHHIQSVPQPLRRAVIDKIDPTHLPCDFDWAALLGTQDVPSKERLDQLLCGDYVQRLRLSTLLWKLHPNSCLGWAADPVHPHRELFQENCPPQWAPDLVSEVMRTPSLVAELKTQPHWATCRIAEAGHRASPLLALLSSTGPESQKV